METVEDFDKWLAEYKPVPVKYVAVYDQLTGAVTSVGPDYAFQNEEHVVSVDSETALSIITAEIQIHHCQIDIHSGELEIAETRTLNKLDDVLYVSGGNFLSNVFFNSLKTLREYSFVSLFIDLSLFTPFNKLL